MIFRLLFVGAALAFPGGCNAPTLHSRLAQNRELFAQCTPRQQALIRRGMIARGFSPAMVSLVLDRPDEIVAGPGPHQERWIYRTYYAAHGSSRVPTKIVAHEDGVMGVAPGGAMPGSVHGRGPMTYTIEYDPGAIRPSLPSSRRVEILFHLGLVADIQIVNR